MYPQGEDNGSRFHEQLRRYPAVQDAVVLLTSSIQFSEQTGGQISGQQGDSRAQVYDRLAFLLLITVMLHGSSATAPNHDASSWGDLSPLEATLRESKHTWTQSLQNLLSLLQHEFTQGFNTNRSVDFLENLTHVLRQISQDACTGIEKCIVNVLFQTAEDSFIESK